MDYYNQNTRDKYMQYRISISGSITSSILLEYSIFCQGCRVCCKKVLGRQSWRSRTNLFKSVRWFRIGNILIPLYFATAAACRHQPTTSRPMVSLSAVHQSSTCRVPELGRMRSRSRERRRNGVKITDPKEWFCITGHCLSATICPRQGGVWEKSKWRENAYSSLWLP